MASTPRSIYSVAPQHTDAILSEVTEAVAAWPRIAASAGVPRDQSEQIARTHRLDLVAERR